MYYKILYSNINIISLFIMLVPAYIILLSEIFLKSA